MPTSPLPTSYGFASSSDFGALSVVRTMSIPTTWMDIDVRAAAFSGEADVNAQLVALGLSEEDLQARGILRSISIINLSDTATVYQTEFGTVGAAAVNPLTAYATLTPGGGIDRYYPARRQLRKAQVRGSEATVVTVEITFDVLPGGS